MIVKSNNPYPEPKVERQNLEYAKLLLQDYAGEVSEDTAIHLYLFQHFTSEWEEFKEVIREISISEMTHLELLAETIKLLGLKPKYKTFNASNDVLIPWTSDNVNYETDIKKVLEVDINAETKAIETYKLHMEIIDDKYIKQLLSRIIEDEEIHLKIFKEFYSKVKSTS